MITPEEELRGKIAEWLGWTKVSKAFGFPMIGGLPPGVTDGDDWDEVPGLDALILSLRAAVCQNCDGSGSIPVPVGEHFVTHEMALDAGDPSMEGSSMGVEWGAEQCQWCDERKTLLLTADATKGIPCGPHRPACEHNVSNEWGAGVLQPEDVTP